MRLSRAFAIVLELATDNVIEDEDMPRERKKQARAISLVAKYVNNEKHRENQDFT